MPDPGSVATDKAYAAAMKKIETVYKKAVKDLTAKMQAFTKQHLEQDKKKRALLAAGEITEAAYRQWLTSQVFQGKRWEEKVRDAAETLSHANAEAAALVQQGRLTAFAANANYGAYKLDHDLGLNTGWTLYSRESVSRIVSKNPKMLPEWKIDEPKDYIWNEKKVQDIITQGIIQGESIPDITTRMVDGLQTQNEHKMRNFARTAMTGAQNAGRIDSMHHAQDLGIKIRKKWLATRDARTRDAHEELDGQVVDIDEPFITHNRDGSIAYIDHPGDPNADPEQVYNCRCTMINVYPDLDDLPEDTEPDPEAKQMTFDEWMEAKENQEAVQGQVKTENVEVKDERDPVGRLSKETRSALEDYTGGEELHLDQKQFDEIKDAMQETERPQYRVESASRTFEKDELEEGDTFNFAQRAYESKDAEEGALRSFTQEERCLSDLVGQVDDPVIFRTNGQVDVLPIDSISGYDQAETLVFADGWKVTGTDMMEIDGKYYTVCDIEHVDPKTVVAIEEPKPEPRPIVQGTDISETWERRKSEFNTEIEDVINTQGFDGNPQLVGREEFDKAVQESGFVAQRSYSAPDKETLEAYREQLYNGGQGNWYVDCGTGGAQYGQGMYCAADYTGTITDGMQEEMKHYTELGESRYKTAQSDFAEKVYQDEMAKVELPIDEKYRDALTDEFGITELGTKTTSEDREFVREWMKDHPKEASELKEEYAAAQRRGVEKGTEIERLTKEEFTEKYPEHAPQSYTETITLTPDAKIITYDDALKLQQEYRNGHSYETSKSIARDAVLEELGIAGRDKIDAITLMNLYNSPATKKTMDRISTLEGKLGMGKDGRPKTYDVIRLIDTRTTALRKNVMTDIGSIVAAHGYDAINAQGHGESGSYTVILNRTKTIILDGRK